MHGEDNTDHEPSTVVEYVVGGGREKDWRNAMTAKVPIRALSAKI